MPYSDAVIATDKRMKDLEKFRVADPYRSWPWWLPKPWTGFEK